MSTSQVPWPIHDDSVISPLPVNHFLSRRVPTPPPVNSASSIRYWTGRARPDTSSLAAADYDVSVKTGFLPPREPVRRLRLAGWNELEIILERGQKEISQLDGGGVGRLGESWRSSVRSLEMPRTDLLEDLPNIRRAHVLLAFVGHMYIHSTYPSLSTIPASIAIPWVDVSDRLGLPPILTYADTVLWNWKLIDPSLGITADNVTINTTFTSSPSERAFFLLSLLCELHAPNLLRLMSAALDESFFADSLALPRIAGHLIEIASIIDEISIIMDEGIKGEFGAEMEAIGPEIFYWEIRPWFNGGKWYYEGVEGEGKGLEMEWGGPSAGQSSLIHAIDLFLGVDHSPRPTKDDSPAISLSGRNGIASTSTASMDPQKPLPPVPIVSKPFGHQLDSTFMLRASQYMPSHHRSFLLHLSSLPILSPTNPHPLPSVRTMTIDNPDEIGEEFNLAVRSMKHFRDYHFKIVARFIISQSKKAPGMDTVFYDEFMEKKALEEEEPEKKMKGTGGTELVSFLKTCRERTIEALV